MKVKACPASYKSAAAATDGGTGQPGVFEAIVSVFGNVDAVGDVVMPGAFAKSLNAWQSSPDNMPVLWSHRMDDPRYNIGAVLEAAELSPGDKRIPDWAHPHVRAHGGLWVKAVLDIGEDASPIAIAAHRLLLKRRVTQFSYSYDINDEKQNGEGHNELHELHVHEISPTQIGANQLTELADAKSTSDDARTPPSRRPLLYRSRAEIAAWEIEYAAG